MGGVFDNLYSDEGFVRVKENFSPFLLRKHAVLSAAGILRGKKILEVGCGISNIVQPSKNVVYGDVSPVAVDFLKRKGLDARVMDVKKLGFKSSHFDVVVCSEVLEHVDDDSGALRELFRVVKPGGVVLLTVPVHRYYWCSDDVFVGHLRRYSVGALKRLVLESGFSSVGVRKIGNPLERLTEILAVFLMSSNGDKRSSLPGFFVSLFVFFNRVWAFLLFVFTFFTPMMLVSNVLVEARK